MFSILHRSLVLDDESKQKIVKLEVMKILLIEIRRPPMLSVQERRSVQLCEYVADLHDLKIMMINKARTVQNKNSNEYT